MKTEAKYIYVVYDKDGETLAVSEEDYDTEAEAEKAVRFWEDEPRYGSHEVEEV